MIESGFYWDKLFPALNHGLYMTLTLVIPSAFLGLFLGIILGGMRVFGCSFLRRLCNAYVALFRGVPLLLQLYFLYYALPSFGIFFNAYEAAILGFVLCSGAYHSEYIRGGLLAIRQGQIKAAEALGFSKWLAIKEIIMPQALRLALPGCGNEIIYLIKYSSLAYMLSFIELTGEAKELSARSFNYIEVYTVAGLYYLFLTSLASLVLRYCEKRISIPGLGQAYHAD